MSALLVRPALLAVVDPQITMSELELPPVHWIEARRPR
jgi:hypothetical protein